MGTTRAVLGAIAMSLAVSCSRGSAPRVTAAPVAASVASDRRSSEDAGAPVQTQHEAGGRVTRVTAAGLTLGDFVIAAAPSAGREKGTLVALGWGPESPPALFVVEIDLATESEIGRLPLGTATTAMVVPANQGPVVAAETPFGLTVVWLDGARSIRARYLVSGLGADSGFELAGFAALGNRLVVVDGGRAADTKVSAMTRAIVLDEHGARVAEHTCPGGPAAGGPTPVEPWGDRAVLTGLVDETAKPVCAFRLVARAGTQKATLGAMDEIFAESGALYVRSLPPEPAGDWRVRRIGDDLRPTGKEVPDPRHDEPIGVGCAGVPGGLTKSVRVAGLRVLRTTSCCGDPPGGLFVCDPGA